MIYQGQFSSAQNIKIARAKDALGRLRVNPRDAVAVMEFYETCSRELQEVAVRYFGKSQLGKRAVLNLLAAVVSRARTCELQATLTKEWVVQCAEDEARKLRAALDAGSSSGRRARRVM